MEVKKLHYCKKIEFRVSISRTSLVLFSFTKNFAYILYIFRLLIRQRGSIFCDMENPFEKEKKIFLKRNSQKYRK